MAKARSSGEDCEGRLAKGTLAWMLDVDEEELEVDEPLPEEFPDSEADLAVFME